jgi:arylsulfatase A-like enzyme/Tfp pilus assembly protein PilF
LRKLLLFLGTSWLALWMIPATAPAQSTTIRTGKDRWNVLLITVDTLRPDRLGCFGNSHMKTPTVDGLARRGGLFRRAFAHVPETLPSHTDILLGTTPLTHGVHDNQHFVVDEGFLTLAEHLKKYGYATGAFVGAFPLDSRFGLTHGFDVYDDHYGTSSSQEFSFVERKAEVVVKAALDWLGGQKGPWFLWVHCFDPHQRYDPPEPFKTEYQDRLYDGEVAYVDYSLGKLLGYLSQKDLTEKTLVIFTGDHGESLGQHGESTHGYFAYNSTLWVPLIIDVPGIKPVTVDQYVCHIDIFPTVCEALGIEKPSHLQGYSLLPVMKGKKLPDREIYFESLDPYYSRGWAPLRGFLKNSIKFIDSPIPELYDMQKDFDETKNLADSAPLDPYRASLAATMEKQTDTGRSSAYRKADRQTLEKLRSLGYASNSQVTRKESYSAQDDLKALLPYQSQLQQAMGAYHKGDFEKSENLLKGIIAERKDFDLAYTYLATLYKEQRKFREAIQVLQQGYQVCPGNYKIIITYGMFLTEVGAYDAAVEILKHGLALIDYDPELWNYLGIAYWKKNDFGEAQKAFDQSLALDHDYPIALNNRGSLYLSIYLKSRQEKDLQQAVRNFAEAIELDPNYESAYNGKGTALQMAGDIDGAIANWTKAVELKPDYGFALYNLGLAYLLKGDKVRALGNFQKYKALFYATLSQREREKLDDCMAKCK